MRLVVSPFCTWHCAPNRAIAARQSSLWSGALAEQRDETLAAGVHPHVGQSSGMSLEEARAGPRC